MLWTEITRAQYRRDGLRCASDATDGEWALIEPHLPPARPLGRPRVTDLREVVNALLYLLTGGRRWRMLPKAFPPYSTVQRFFHACATTAPGGASTTPCCWRRARRRGARRARRPGSSTARA